MSKIIKYTGLLLLVLLLVGCTKRYEEKYDHLALNFTQYSLNTDGGSLMITVYYSGIWDASFTTEPDWAYLTCTHNRGIAQLRVVYEPAASEIRTLSLRIVCDNGEEALITLKQAGI